MLLLKERKGITSHDDEMICVCGETKKEIGTQNNIVLHVEHLREAMAQLNNRFLTLFGCTLNDWMQDICSPDQLLIQF